MNYGMCGLLYQGERMHITTCNLQAIIRSCESRLVKWVPNAAGNLEVANVLKFSWIDLATKFSDKLFLTLDRVVYVEVCIPSTN